jgi:hypothetical protein
MWLDELEIIDESHQKYLLPKNVQKSYQLI